MAGESAEARVASLRTGIKMVLGIMADGGILSSAAKLDISRTSLTTLLDCDLDKALGEPPPPPDPARPGAEVR